MGGECKSGKSSSVDKIQLFQMQENKDVLFKAPRTAVVRISLKMLVVGGITL